jgi:hypothetical protein
MLRAVLTVEFSVAKVTRVITCIVDRALIGWAVVGAWMGGWIVYGGGFFDLSADSIAYFAGAVKFGPGFLVVRRARDNLNSG